MKDDPERPQPWTLQDNTTGGANTASGEGALLLNTTGSFNIAVGRDALRQNSFGSDNTAVGRSALASATGFSNIALGINAGLNVTNGNNNIHIGNNGLAESGIIRIGTVGTHQGTLIAGINGSNVGAGAGVFVNGSGQLGTLTSAARFKKGIEPVGEGSRRLLALRPVRFRYKPAYDDPARPLQYGLVAEEVAEVFPDLVHPDADGAPYSVRYQLSVLLLSELQRQERRLDAQQRELDELRAQVRALVGGKAATSP